MFLVATLIELDSEKQSGMIYTTAINEVYYPFISRINLVEQVYYLYDTKPPRLVSPKSKRGVMTKSLEQIQQENRKFILEAIHGCIYYESARDGIIIGKPITLSRVLLALPSELYYYSCDLLYLSKPNQDPKEQITWDLTKETLEEQTEWTQRAINKLFND